MKQKTTQKKRDRKKVREKDDRKLIAFRVKFRVEAYFRFLYFSYWANGAKLVIFNL